MANTNGFGAQNAALYGGMNGSVLPNAGQFSDMQLLMSNLESLSGLLESNRHEWTQVQEGLAKVERLHGRLSKDGQLPLSNGDIQSTDPDAAEPPTVTQLQAALAAAHARTDALERTHQDFMRLQQHYDETLDDTLRRVRQYCFEQATHTVALHQHYTALLAQARGETLDAQLTHQAWQAGLQRVSEGVRMALAAREAEGRPWRRRIAALKEENRVLRAKVGWDPPVDSEDEGLDGAEDGPAPAKGRVNLIGQEMPR